MLTSRRIGLALAVAVALAAADRPARAGLWHYPQVQYVAAPAAAPTYVTMPAAAPTYYSVPAQAPAVAAPAPVYMMPAPAPAASAPAPAAAPVQNMFYYTSGSAPAAASAPGAGGGRLQGAFRAALIADLNKLYNGADAGTTRLERITTLREDGATAYASYARTEDAELTEEQKSDLDYMINEIVKTDLERPDSRSAYLPGPSGFAAPYGYQYPPNVVPVQYYAAPAPQPVNLVPLVPIQYAAPKHSHFWKH